MNLFQNLIYNKRRFLILIFNIWLIYISTFIILNYFLCTPSILSLIRAISGFIWLTFVPGGLLIAILGYHSSDDAIALLYSVGLSAVFISVSGLFANTFFSALGIQNPVSEISIISILTVFISILCIFYYIKPISIISIVNEKGTKVSTTMLFILLQLPMLAIFGTYYMNISNNNSLIVFFLIVVCLVPFLMAYDKIKHYYYIFFIFIISISLLYHKSLISMNITGSDIQTEYNIASSIVQIGSWNPNIQIATSSMLSISMLAPIYSIILGTSVTWVFKVVYPFFYALVPVGMYIIYQKQTNNNISFFACYLFITTSIYYGIMLEAMRQMIAELFIVLLMVAMIDQKCDKTNKSIFMLIFSFGLITSHYGCAYIYLLVLIITDILVLAIRYLNPTCNITDINSKLKLISSNYIVFYIILLLSWYIFLIDSVIFIKFVTILTYISDGLIDLANPDNVEALNYISKDMPLSQEITKYLHMIVYSFISVGVLLSFIKRNIYIIKLEYLLLSSSFLLILIISLTMPYTSSTMSTGRVISICSIFLSQFFVIGVICLSSLFIRNYFSIYKFLALFLSLFLLFNSGLVAELYGEVPPTSISLNSDAPRPPKLSDAQIKGAEWLYSFRSLESLIYRDSFEYYTFNRIFEYKPDYLIFITNSTSRLPPNSYIFLGPNNIKNDQIEVRIFKRSGIISREYQSLGESIFYKYISTSSKIYENNGTKIFLKN